MAYRKIDVQDTRGRIHYRAECNATGEVYECSDLTPLLRKMVLDTQGKEAMWSLQSFEIDHAPPLRPPPQRLPVERL